VVADSQLFIIINLGGLYDFASNPADFFGCFEPSSCLWNSSKM